MKQRAPDIETRRAIFEALANLDILDLIAQGDDEQIRERMEECMSLWQE